MHAVRLARFRPAIELVWKWVCWQDRLGFGPSVHGFLFSTNAGCASAKLCLRGEFRPEQKIITMTAKQSLHRRWFEVGRLLDWEHKKRHWTASTDCPIIYCTAETRIVQEGSPLRSSNGGLHLYYEKQLLLLLYRALSKSIMKYLTTNKGISTKHHN